MIHKYTDTYNRIALSPLSPEAIEPLRLLRNRERQWFVYSEIIGHEAQRRWYEKYLSTESDYMFEVHLKTDPRLFIGAVALYNLDHAKNTVEFGRIIIDSKTTEEKGLGLDTTLCACKIAFELLGVQRVVLEVLANNSRAIRTYEKAGFIRYNSSANLIHMYLERDRFAEIIIDRKGNI